MAKLTMVTGLPGSGKSRLCKNECSNKQNLIRFSDVQHPDIIHSDNGIPGVIESLKSGYDCWVDDVSFCFESKRQSFHDQVSAGCKTKFETSILFFEFSPLKCLINIVGDATILKRKDWNSRINAYKNHLQLEYQIPIAESKLKVVIRPDFLPILDHTDCITLISEIEKLLRYSLETNSQAHLISEEDTASLLEKANQLKDTWELLREKE